MLRIDEEETYIEVVEKFADMVFRIAYQNCFNKSDSQDVAQDVFVKLLSQKGRTFRDMEHIKAWLIKVTLNRCKDYSRFTEHRKEISIEEWDGTFLEDKQEVLPVLEELQREERTIVYLHYFEGYSIREIAQLLGKKQNTIGSKLGRARKKLGKLLEENKKEEIL